MAKRHPARRPRSLRKIDGRSGLGGSDGELGDGDSAEFSMEANRPAGVARFPSLLTPTRDDREPGRDQCTANLRPFICQKVRLFNRSEVYQSSSQRFTNSERFEMRPRCEN